MYMLDTNMASYVVTGRSVTARISLADTAQYADIAISALTEGEIRFGLEKKSEAVRVAGAFEEFFSAVQILPWSSDVAKAYGKLRASMNATGKSLSVMDMLLASHALSAGAVLVSHDRAFRHVEPMLTVADWAADV